MYPGLSVFSDISWDKITKEYLAGHDERPQDVEEFVFGFPQFLQDKASREECPSHLFELAYFELIENELRDKIGLNIQFKIKEMDEAFTASSIFV
jgi:hypothetical protein